VIDHSTSSQQQRLMISYQILKKIRGTQVHLTESAYTQVHLTESAYIPTIIMFMRCIPPVPYFKEKKKHMWGFTLGI